MKEELEIVFKVTMERKDAIILAQDMFDFRHMVNEQKHWDTERRMPVVYIRTGGDTLRVF